MRPFKIWTTQIGWTHNGTPQKWDASQMITWNIFQIPQLRDFQVPKQFRYSHAKQCQCLRMCENVLPSENFETNFGHRPTHRDNQKPELQMFFNMTKPTEIVFQRNQPKTKNNNIYSGFFRPVFEHDQQKRKLGSLFAYHHAHHAQKLSDGAWTNPFKLLSSLSCRGSVPAPNPSNEFWKQYLFLKVTAWPRHPDGRWNVPNHLCMLVICGQSWIGYSFGRRVCQPRAPKKVKPPKCQVPCEPKKLGRRKARQKRRIIWKILEVYMASVFWHFTWHFFWHI